MAMNSLSDARTGFQSRQTTHNDLSAVAGVMNGIALSAVLYLVAFAAWWVW